MSTLLRIDNFAPANLKDLGRVAIDAAAGQAIIKFGDVGEVSVGDVVYVGRRGTESTERLVVQSINPSTLEVTFTGNLTKEHRRYQPITLVRGDDIRVYRAPNVDGTQPADGAFALLATIGIDGDDPATDYQDAAGGSNYWYKITYYNSVSTYETDLAQSSASRGGSFGHYAKIDAIRDKAGMANNTNIVDSKIASARTEAESEINSTLIGFYFLPFADPVPPTIERICRLLAAGVLLNDDYGPVNMGASSQRGDAFMKEGRALLEKITTRNALVEDQLLKSLLLPASNTVASWPNAQTATTDSADGGSTRKFRMDYKF